MNLNNVCNIGLILFIFTGPVFQVTRQVTSREIPLIFLLLCIENYLQMAVDWRNLSSWNSDSKLPTSHYFELVT